MKRYTRDRTCVYNINYHILWCVKYRRKALTEPIAARLKELLVSIGQEKGFSVEACEVGLQDHIHCFVSAPPKISVTQIVKYLKGISGNRLLNEIPELRQILWKGHLWGSSYFVETTGSTSESNVREYIARQERCQH